MRVKLNDYYYYYYYYDYYVTQLLGCEVTVEGMLP